MNSEVLETERLLLKRFESEDAELFQRLSADPFIRKYLWDDEIISIETAEEIMAANDKYFKEKQFGIWKIILKSAESVIGYTGLWYFFDENQPQLIYAILESETKKGYATEAAKAIVEYAFEKLKFNYLTAAMDDIHQESLELAKRIGMQFFETRLEEGKATSFYKIEKVDVL